MRDTFGKMFGGSDHAHEQDPLEGLLSELAKGLGGRSKKDEVLELSGFTCVNRIETRLSLFFRNEETSKNEDFQAAVDALQSKYMKEVQELAKQYFGDQVLTVDEIKDLTELGETARRDAIFAKVGKPADASEDPDFGDGIPGAGQMDEAEAEDRDAA